MTAAGASNGASKGAHLVIADILPAMNEIASKLPGGGPALLENMLKIVLCGWVDRAVSGKSCESYYEAVSAWVTGEGVQPGRVKRSEKARIHVTVDEDDCSYAAPCRALRKEADSAICVRKVVCEQAVSQMTGGAAAGILLDVQEGGCCVFEIFPVSAEMLKPVDRVSRDAANTSRRYMLAKSRLSDVETHYRAILEATASAILVLDESLRVTYINPRARGVFAVTEDNAVGRRFERGSVFGAIGDLCLDVADKLNGWEGETTIENREGERVHNIYHLRLSRFKSPGSGEREILLVLEDVTREELLRSELANQARRLEVAVNEKTGELREANVRLRALAQTDSLTGLANRRMFDQILQKELKRARRMGHDVGVILADIDGFKAVNDICGHNIGDEVLGNVASILLQSVRETDTVARWGGDEFIVLLPHAGTSECATVAGRISDMVNKEKCTMADVEIPPIGLSIGWSSSTRDDPAALIAAADRMMYDEKARRKAKASREAD